MSVADNTVVPAACLERWNPLTCAMKLLPEGKQRDRVQQSEEPWSRGPESGHCPGPAWMRGWGSSLGTLAGRGTGTVWLGLGIWVEGIMADGGSAERTVGRGD